MRPIRLIKRLNQVLVAIFWLSHIQSFIMIRKHTIMRKLPLAPWTRRNLSSSHSQMEEIMNLCKKTGYVFQSSEIYGSMAGFYDYGPLGVELKNNIKKLWWRDMVQRREDIVGLDSSIISSPAIWKASGHIEGFSDPMVDCKDSKLRFRADQVFWAPIETLDGQVVCYWSTVECENMSLEAEKKALKYAASKGYKGPFKPLALHDLTNAPSEIYHLIPSPATGIAGGLTIPRDFNLMFETKVGAVKDESAVAYLRPETAQGIFTNFAAVQRSARMKIPFGIAQIGKAFRNEITPRNFIFRSREFEQMEIEYFIPPDEDAWQKWYQEWIDLSFQWLRNLGIPDTKLHLKVHGKDKLAHYARACTDINFDFSFGNQELMGIAARGNYDLLQHSSSSGKSLEYHDPNSNAKYIPHVIEPSLGVDRLFLALISAAYRVEQVGKEKRVVLSLKPSVAPIKACVLPLVSNKQEIVEKSKQILRLLKMKYMVQYDSSGAIGRRYRRADECGVPFCITVDYDSLVDDTITLRWRDSMEQKRMKTSELLLWLSQEIDE